MYNANFSRRNFIKMSSILGASLVVGSALTGCTGAGNPSTNNAESAGVETPSTSSDKSGGKTLVAYYSAQGHTRRVAEIAAEDLGADLFEIVPAEPYSDGDLDWTDEQSRVTREHENESLRDTPLANTAPDNWTDYDTILIGYPIWWAIAAWPINRFAADNDFTGKKVIPFCTSSSSELGQSATLLADAAGSGSWVEGQRFSSDASDGEVRAWARGI